MWYSFSNITDIEYKSTERKKVEKAWERMTGDKEKTSRDCDDFVRDNFKHTRALVIKRLSKPPDFEKDFGHLGSIVAINLDESLFNASLWFLIACTPQAKT